MWTRAWRLGSSGAEPARRTERLVADDGSLVHLELRRDTGVSRALTAAMDPGRLLVVLEGMFLAIEVARNRSLLGSAAPHRHGGPSARAADRLQESEEP
jgi:hypothetical protein